MEAALGLNMSEVRWAGAALHCLTSFHVRYVGVGNRTSTSWASIDRTCPFLPPCNPTQPWPQWKGHHLRVDRAAPRAAKGAVLFDPRRSLFVGSLPLDAEVRGHEGGREQIWHAAAASQAGRSRAPALHLYIRSTATRLLPSVL